MPHSHLQAARVAGAGGSLRIATHGRWEGRAGERRWPSPEELLWRVITIAENAGGDGIRGELELPGPEQIQFFLGVNTVSRGKAFPVPCGTGPPFPPSQLQEPALPIAPLPRGSLSSRGSTGQRRLLLPRTHQPSPIAAASSLPGSLAGARLSLAGSRGTERGVPGGGELGTNPAPRLRLSLLWAPGKVSPKDLLLAGSERSSFS